MTDSVYRVTEVIGTSSESWEAAAANAVATAAGSVRDLRVAEVIGRTSRSRTVRSRATGYGSASRSSTRAATEPGRPFVRTTVPPGCAAAPPGGPGKEIDDRLAEPLGTGSDTDAGGARRRADLYQAILGLEQAASRPAVAREEEWLTGVIEALDDLEGEILDHIEITERHDGLYAEIVEAAPRLSLKVQLLRDEHPQMQEATSSLKARLTAARDGDALSVDDTARDEIQRLLGRLVKHRQRGADLVWEAYTRDIGGAD